MIFFSAQGCLQNICFKIHPLNLLKSQMIRPLKMAKIAIVFPANFTQIALNHPTQYRLASTLNWQAYDKEKIARVFPVTSRELSLDLP